MASYISPKVRIGDSRASGKGLFASEPIKKDEVLMDYTGGFGKFVSAAEADELFKNGYDHMIQVDDDLFFAATEEVEFEEADYLNHSCDPNCGIRDKLKIVAMRDIKPGEELAVDYAMMESTDFEIPCGCGSANCRHLITGNDWKLPELQERYRGYFSEYLQKKISSL